MLTEPRIYILRSIAATGDVERTADDHQDVVELIAAGYIERDRGTLGWFKITSRVQRAIGELPAS